MSFAIMGGVSESYFSAYAVFLKATAPQIGLLASLPPLLASFAQILAVWIGQVTGIRRGIIVAGALVQVCALVCVASLPELFPEHAFPMLLASVVVYFVGPNLGAPLWGSLMGALIPEAVRGRFFARRTRLSSMASFSSLISAGIILQAFDTFGHTLYGFLAIFSIGMFARAVSAWHLSQIHDPPRAHKEAPAHERDGLISLRVLRENPNFLRFSTFFACMQFAVAISGPFVVVYLLRDLHYTYIELTANTAASVLVQFLVLSRWGRLGDLFGNRIIIRVTGFSIPAVPMLWVLSGDFWYLILVQAISGLLWSGYSLASSNFLFDLTPQAKRGGMMAFHNLLSSAGVFLGASFGGYLALHLPRELDLGFHVLTWTSVFYGVFLTSSALRLVIASSFLPHLQEVRNVRNMTYHGLIFRVTRFSPISGLIFDVVSRVRRSGENDDK
ncbi:MAG: MFS transporter [Pseudomonadales bacterium]|nr:MFS transporter [Pseudomonadales bacterium]